MISKRTNKGLRVQVSQLKEHVSECETTGNPLRVISFLCVALLLPVKAYKKIRG